MSPHDFVIFLAMLVLTLTYPLIVSWITPVEWGPLATGYLGLFLQAKVVSERF